MSWTEFQEIWNWRVLQKLAHPFAFWLKSDNFLWFFLAFRSWRWRHAFVWNVGKHVLDYTALYAKRKYPYIMGTLHKNLGAFLYIYLDNLLPVKNVSNKIMRTRKSILCPAHFLHSCTDFKVMKQNTLSYYVDLIWEPLNWFLIKFYIESLCLPARPILCYL